MGKESRRRQDELEDIARLDSLPPGVREMLEIHERAERALGTADSAPSAGVETTGASTHWRIGTGTGR